jgi:crossover junction endodeoxyribonuclease RuvC
MKIVGLDLSLAATGVSDGLTTWTVKSTGHKGDTLWARADRLRDLRVRIMHTIPPDTAMVVVEGPAFGSQTGHMHDRSGLFWLVVQRLLFDGIAVAEVPPACLKRMATGRGNATKGAMIEAATRRFPHIEIAGDDNRVDALFLAAMGYEHLGAPIVSLPASHLAGMAAVQFPQLAGAS